MSQPPETPEANVTSPWDGPSGRTLHDVDGAVASWTDTELIEVAAGIVMARHDCTPDEAVALLNAAAKEHDMTLSDLGRCLLAEEELRYRPRTSPG